jgi:hypothetical protein
MVRPPLLTTGDGRLWLQTGLVLPWCGLSSRRALFWATSLLTVRLTVGALAQGFMRSGFPMMHDGAHHSDARHQRVHERMPFTRDGLGGSHVRSGVSSITAGATP